MVSVIWSTNHPDHCKVKQFRSFGVLSNGNRPNFIYNGNWVSLEQENVFHDPGNNELKFLQWGEFEIEHYY
jgi:hypothetical protein